MPLTQPSLRPITVFDFDLKTPLLRKLPILQNHLSMYFLQSPKRSASWVRLGRTCGGFYGWRKTLSLFDAPFQ